MTLTPRHVRAEMNRVFGPANWDLTFRPGCGPQVVDNGDGTYTATYAVTAQIGIHTTDAVYEGTAARASVHRDPGLALDEAIELAEAWALVRAAVNLGDPFGSGVTGGHLELPAVRRVLLDHAKTSHSPPAGPSYGPATNPRRRAPHLTVLPGGRTAQPAAGDDPA